MATSQLKPKSTTTKSASYERDLIAARAMCDNAPVNIILADTDLKIVYMNPASVRTLKGLEHLLPCRVDEVVGKSIDIFHKDPRVQRRILSSDRNLPHRAVINLGPEKLDLLVSATYDAQEKYLGPMVTWEVVTEKLKLERAAAERSAMVENAPVNIILADTDLNITYMNPASTRTLKKLEHLLPCKAEEVVGKNVDLFHKNPAYQRAILANYKAFPRRAQIKLADDTLDLLVSATYDQNGSYIGPMVTWEIITEKLKMEADKAESDRREREAQETLRNKVDQLMGVVNAAAQGDLTREIPFTGGDAVGELASGLKTMLGDLRNMIGQVVESAAQFTEGSRVIAESSQSLAQGAQTQSSAVEEMSASIEQLARSIDSVKNNAVEADRMAKETTDLAQDGGTAVRKSSEAMELIRSSSGQISEIIQVISEIASQTNLLALNAAIEAARAGEHGLGFAVVADEVRKLAERSSHAAKEISSLIKESTKRVEEGANLSSQTGASLERIVKSVGATATKISEIATATVEQASNAKEVASAIQNVAQVTDQAAAGSEELASSSEELGAQASGLRDVVSRFKTE